jgi:hypothetical protein
MIAALKNCCEQISRRFGSGGGAPHSATRRRRE